MLDPSGISHVILSRSSIVRYMRTHFERWIEFANGRFGLGLKDEELLFVSGTIKTSRWAVATFYGDYREKQGAVTGKLGSLAAVEFSLAISDMRLDSSYYRVGPPKSRQRVAPSDKSIADGPNSESNHVEAADKHDRCIFLHYYKMKRRRMLRGRGPIQAAAGPHDLPPDSDDDDSSTQLSTDKDYSEEIDQVPCHEKVGILVDLSQITSHRHLRRLTP